MPVIDTELATTSTEQGTAAVVVTPAKLDADGVTEGSADGAASSSPRNDDASSRSPIPEGESVVVVDTAAQRALELEQGLLNPRRRPVASVST